MKNLCPNCKNKIPIKIYLGVELSIGKMKEKIYLVNMVGI